MVVLGWIVGGFGCEDIFVEEKGIFVQVSNCWYMDYLKEIEGVVNVSKKNWEQEYDQADLVWGLIPDPLLVKYHDIVPAGPVLDLGIGEGRNAFLFSKLGYQVEGVDISERAVERCRQLAEENGF